MPRTIDSIVECHQVARSRRIAGEKIWDASVPIKSVLERYKAAGDDLTPEQAVELCQGIAALLKSNIPAAWRDHDHANHSYDYEDLFERLEQCGVVDFTPTKDLEITPCEVVNDWLDELYDWGDRYRVWLG